MACIFRRGKKEFWWIKYYADGKQHYHSLSTKDRAVARAKKVEIESQLARHEFIAPSRLPIEPFLEEYCQFLRTIRTEKSYKNDVSRLRMFFGPVCDALLPGNVKRQSQTAEQVEVPEDKYAALHVYVSRLEDLTSGAISRFITQRVADRDIGPKTANNYREKAKRGPNTDVPHDVPTRSGPGPAPRD